MVETKSAISPTYWLDFVVFYSLKHTEEEKVCVCILDREGNRVFASRVPVVVETAVYLLTVIDRFL